MARPGYIETRKHFYKVQDWLDSAKQSLAPLDADTQGYPPELKEIHRAQRQKSFDELQVDYEQAKQAYAAFNPPEFKEMQKEQKEHLPIHFAVGTLAVSDSQGVFITKKLQELT